MKPHEINICYTINLTKKPIEYFYEIKSKKGEIIFELFDVKKDSIVDTFEIQPPITGISILENKVDLNVESRGRKPDWHSRVMVEFKTKYFPKIDVENDTNGIVFKYKWSSDSTKIQEYISKGGMVIYDPGGPIIDLLSILTFFGIAVGVLFLLRK
jgi:hypothetical protein